MKVFIALGLLGSAAVTAAPLPVPAQVSSHVNDGHFDPGDYSWLRGSFPGASPAEVRDWAAMKAYRESCSGEVPDATRAEMASLGEHPPTAYWQVYSSDVCGELAIATRSAAGFTSWASYRAALDGALPYYRTFLFAVDKARAIAVGDEGTLHDRLLAIVLPDQMLREALSWGQGDASDAPQVDSKTHEVLTALLWRPISDIDHRNTKWLKTVIAKDGWPTISKVGEQASNNAWLLVQHADDDPVFQLRVLRLIEPLAKRGEVDRHNYALLYDRVMLPLTGKQRYGTQFTCDEKGWRPQTLENDATVDERRKEAGLGPIAEYAKELIAHYGEHCS